MTPHRRVTVVICTRNRADRLPQVVGLLRAQDYPQDAAEILVVDNCSTDHTRQVVQALAAQAGIPLRYVFEAKDGITFARNRGAKGARYPYVAYVDDDCSVGRDWLRELMSGFDLDERVVGVGGLVVAKLEDQRPSWLGPEMEVWLADTSFLGYRRRLLDDERVVESNTAFERTAWHAAGGFLGMEQFGSQNMAAGEVLYLLHQLRRRGGKIAFVPEAVMHHHVRAPSRRRLLRRAYWQGVSDAILRRLLYRRSWGTVILHTARDLVALLVLLGYAAASYCVKGSSPAMFHLMRAVWRLGFLFSQLHLAGDWPRIRSWSSGQMLSPAGCEFDDDPAIPGSRPLEIRK